MAMKTNEIIYPAWRSDAFDITLHEQQESTLEFKFFIKPRDVSDEKAHLYSKFKMKAFGQQQSIIWERDPAIQDPVRTVRIDPAKFSSTKMASHISVEVFAFNNFDKPKITQVVGRGYAKPISRDLSSLGLYLDT